MRRTMFRRTVTAAGVGILALGAACSSPALPQGSGAHEAPAPPAVVAPVGTSVPPSADSSPVPPPQLPLGGRSIFPDHLVIADYGSSGGAALGVLGVGSPDEAAEAVTRRAQLYTSFGRRVQPAMELIATVALNTPGPDGTYSSRGNLDAVQRYLDAAHRHHELLILDFQPGRGDYLPEVARFEKFLIDPSVGVALDPEWNVGRGEVPGQVIGSSSAAQINAVSTYLSGLVAAHDLPDKLFVVHQFRTTMLPDREQITPAPGLETVLHADGFGAQTTKIAVYHALAIPIPPFHPALKLFLTQDTNMMSPQQVMALNPPPEMITYQ